MNPCAQALAAFRTLLKSHQFCEKQSEAAEALWWSRPQPGCPCTSQADSSPG